MECTLDCANQPGTRHWHLDACAMRGRSIEPPDPGLLAHLDQVHARELDLRKRSAQILVNFVNGCLMFDEFVDDLVDLVNQLAHEHETTT